MEEQHTTTTYTIPTSPEARLNYTVSPRSEAELALAAALEHSASIHSLDTDDVNRQRAESIGASTISATAGAHVDTGPEVFFDPSDMRQLLACTTQVIIMRRSALSNEPQPNGAR